MDRNEPKPQAPAENEIEALHTKLAGEVDVVDWAPLRLHAKREALFFVANSLDVVDVGLALARNRGPIVAHWLSEQLLRRPTEAELAAIEQAPAHERFRVLIVQPYVLAQRQAGTS